MALSAATSIKQASDVSIVAEDGTGTAVTLTLRNVMPGIAIGNMTQAQRAYNKYELRGVFKSARLGSRTYPTISMSFMFVEFTNAATGEFLDFVRKVNAYSANISTLGASAEVYACNYTITVEGTDHGDGADGTIKLLDVIGTWSWSEGGDDSPAILTFEGESTSPTVTATGA